MPHDSSDASFPNIYIVGPSLLHNQLLALCLEKELQVECTCLPDVAVQDKEIIETKPERVRIFLLDCSRRETAELEKTLKAGKAIGTGSFLVALFNVDPASGIERLVRRHRICGIFYENDSRDVLLKGMRKILKGEMWLSRRLLSECALRSGRQRDADDHAVTSLSDREKEALKLLALGFSNKEIAEKMRLSPHTVKTHLYHVYKKVGVTNRLQAILWAAAYLCE
jgi:DNA-binding NarL/FixJ family response regulator